MKYKINQAYECGRCLKTMSARYFSAGIINPRARLRFRICDGCGLSGQRAKKDKYSLING